MLHIQQLPTDEPYPYALLLLADETKEAIDRYLFDSEVYLVYKNTTLIGVYCLYKIVEQRLTEIKNIAINEQYQGKGYGSWVLSAIKKQVQPLVDTLIVGTADVGHPQIHFYESNGFVQFGVRKNFFIDHYQQPIFENGQQLIDMVLLKYELASTSS